MPEALQAAELIAIVGVLVALAFMYGVRGIFQGIAGLLDMPILGTHPFRFLADGIDQMIIYDCNKVIASLEWSLKQLFAGLEWSIKETVAGLVGLANGVTGAFHYLWNTALPVYIRLELTPIRAAIALYKATTDGIGSWIGNMEVSLQSHLGTATKNAVTEATRLIGIAKTDTLREVDTHLAGVLTTVHQDITRQIGVAEGLGQGALDAYERANDAAVSAAQSLAGEVSADLKSLEGAAGLAGLIGIISSVPLLTSLVQTIAVESGLDSAECRGKVKNVCQTNPLAWAQLIEGLALVEGGLHLEDIVREARGLIAEALPILEQVR